MDQDKLLALLERVAAGELGPESAAHELRDLPYCNLEFARVDSHRSIRQGLPEVIFCPGKTPEQIAEIAEKLLDGHDLVIATKAETAVAERVAELSPEGRYEELAGSIVWGAMPEPKKDALRVNIVTAGTADVPVAEEAALIVRATGSPVNKLYDVGVAGIHRLLGNLETLRDGQVTIVVAGMDGALPSVVGGILDGPVIAVPTSVGYGTAFGGVAPLLSALNSCAAGVTVVNIDNGFGAAVAALRIGRAMARKNKAN